MDGKHYIYFLLTIILLTACQQLNNSDASDYQLFDLIDTKEGPVKGFKDSGAIAFKGVPYASPPIGELRWRAPQPLIKREKLLLANKYGNRCIQRPKNLNVPNIPELFTQTESEDCLYLNIYRPDNTLQKLPVMVWLPGGGLVSGSGSRPFNQGNNLSKHGVIVVSINYRLGSFGFFAHPSLSNENLDQGRLYNYGLMDQIAALEWVQDNISEFGGDPKNVTIFGESAGAYSVDMLVASQASSGLFSKAISQSGYGRGKQPKVATLSQDPKNAIEQIGVRLAKKLSLQDATIEELRMVSAEKIVNATNYNNFISFAVDGVLIKENMTALYQKGFQAKVPMILGANDFEFGMFAPAIQKQIMAKELPEAFMNELVSYYGNENLRDTLLYSDYVFHSQIRQLALAHEKQGHNTYVYRFSMPGKGIKPLATPDGKIYGSPHVEEIPYVFGHLHLNNEEPSKEQLATSDLMMKYWTNFAKYGEPNGNNVPHWPPYQGGTIMHFTPEYSKGKTDTWIQRLDKLNSYLP